MGFFEDLGKLIGDVAEATGRAADELVETAAGAVVDTITTDPPRPPRRRRIIIDEYDDLPWGLKSYSSRRRW